MKRHILTIVVEDYFHVAALRGAVVRKHWDRLEPRLEANLDAVLDLLAAHDARATFFVLGWVAERQPELVRRIVDRGHEVASRGYWPRSLRGMERGELLEDLHRAREALEAAGANRIIGYRAPTWIRRDEMWILDVLAEQGYVYDSSINPILRRFAGLEEELRIHKHHHPDRPLSIWELPISTVSVAGFRVAISGGNYVRQFPHTLLKRAVAERSHDDGGEPVVFYFMPWELDRDQPQIQGISRLQRIRHYRNLGKARWVLEDYFSKYQFVGIADHLGLPHAALPPQPRKPSTEVAADVPGRGEHVTIVVPIFNEEKNVGYLRRTLLDFRRRLSGTYRVGFALVDDCSTDQTNQLLRKEFADVADCQIVRHEVNRGVAAAIMTGIRAAPTETVCSIDCDCSYDPQDLERMIPLLANADMVTASPYHPDGKVVNVPSWRLLLSKTLSRMYSAVLDERFHTYTACCRVFRRSAMLPLDIRHGGFLGIAEMLIALKLAGGRIVEHPATLESRLLGESKMKIVRTIRGHLGLLGELVLTPNEPIAAAPAAATTPAAGPGPESTSTSTSTTKGAA